MKIGFIGYGNMAKAIAGGILKKGMVPAAEICAYDHHEKGSSAAQAAGLTLLGSAPEVVQQSAYVFLCVKPQGFAEVLQEIQPFTGPHNVFLSIAAGITTGTIARQLGYDAPVVRAMPNTPLLLGCGTTALTKNNAVKEIDFTFIKNVFQSVGTVYDLPEDKFNEVINVNGSTPAYVYLFAKTVAEYAENSGIPFNLALNMFCDTMKGSAEMLQHAGKTPDELITMVSSKGGTTVAALNAFAETGFADSLRAGMKACVERAYEMGK